MTRFLQVNRFLLAACVFGLALVSFVKAEGAPTSGLEIGERVETFYVRDCTGPASGRRLCYFCRFGNRPVVCIFTKRLDPQVEKLISDVESLAAQHRDTRLAAFVVLLGDDTTETDNALNEFATRGELRLTPLTIYHDQAEKLSKELKISDSATTTVLLWRETVVRANHAFETGELEGGGREAVAESVARLLRNTD